MSAPTVPRRRFLVRTAPGAAPPPASVATPSPPADGEPLVDRVWRQVRDGLDRERLLPADDKRRRDLASAWPSRPKATDGQRMSPPQAHTIDTGKARNRRNAEVALIETVSRWAADVADLLPDRMADLRAIVDYGLHHPQQLPNQSR